MELHERWEELSDYLNFDGIEEKRSTRPDLHAFLLLDELFHNAGRDMVSAAEHDIIFLDVDYEVIEKLTDKQIVELTRCGVHYSEEFGCLAMFA